MMDAMEIKVNKSVVLFITTLSSFLTTFMASSINIALPVIGKEFAIDAVMLSWVATANLLTSAVILLPFGKVADIFGRKKIYISGIIVFFLASLLAALAPNVIVLIVARAVQGVGGAMIFGTAVAILTSVFPFNERGKALGFNLAATYLGLSSGPVIGGILTHQLGWRSVFVMSAVLSIVVIIFVFIKLKAEWADARGEKFDITGSAIYVAGLLAVMYGFSSLPAVRGFVILGAGIITLVVFTKYEKRCANPVLNLKHFSKNTAFIFSNAAAFINYSATFAVAYLVSLYLQYIKGLSPQDAGLIMVAQPITMAIFSPLAGRLSDKIEPRIVASIGMALTAAGLCPFIFINGNTPLVVIVATLVVIGIGFGLFSSPNTNAIMSSVERRFYGVASASVGTMRLTGQAISMGIVTIIFAVHVGKIKITPEHYPQFLTSTHIAFVIFTILCAVGVFASLARGRLR